MNKCTARFSTILIGMITLNFAYFILVATHNPYSSNLVSIIKPSDHRPSIDSTRAVDFESSDVHAAVQPAIRGGAGDYRLKKALELVKSGATKEDLERARALFFQLAETDIHRGRSAYELGRLFQISDGPTCMEIALSWFITSANSGYRKAHFQIGRAFDKGIGTSRDENLALSHYSNALEFGSTSAALPMLGLAKRMLAKKNTGRIRS